MDVFNWQEAANWRESLRKEGKRLVFTNGVFDLFHAGHLEVLERSRSFGDALIVGLNSDVSVRTLKGPGRPIIPETYRARLLLALKCVDAVTTFDQETPAELIRLLLPDILVKGGDYTPETVVGRDTVEANGGEVKIIPLVKGLSSSGIIETIIARYGAEKN